MMSGTTNSGAEADIAGDKNPGAVAEGTNSGAAADSDGERHGNGRASPLASKTRGCHSGWLASCRMAVESRKCATFALRPCTRAFVTSQTFVLLNPGKQTLLSTPWNTSMKRGIAKGSRKFTK